MTNEQNVQATGRIMASKCGAVSFRNNVGGAWSGRKVGTLKNGDTVIRKARWIEFGLVKGSGDTIGWKSVTITPDMVGQKVAQFLSLEYKTDDGRARPDQVNWHNVVHAAGGLSGFARCDDDVRRIISGEKVDP
tara:strand:+ start:217 stop:618 length:402 start_codon:yes stop_codon:yes gene_type:complete